MGWSKEDSKFLVEAVEDVGKISKAGHLKVSWPAVRKWLLSKNISKEAKSCRLRYRNQLAPDLNFSDMTPVEDEAIIFWAKRWGNSWSRIANLISIKSEDAGRRTDNMVKNRYMAHLGVHVVPARQQALHACTTGNATARHRRTVVDYIDKLCAMQNWILASADIYPEPKDLQRLARRIEHLQALADGHAIVRRDEVVDTNMANVKPDAAEPSPRIAKRKRSASPSPSMSRQESQSSLQTGYTTPYRAYDSLPIEDDTFLDGLLATSPCPAMTYLTIDGSHNGNNPSQRRKTHHSQPSPMDSSQMTEKWDGSSSLDSGSPRGNMTQEWQSAAVVEEYDQEFSAYLDVFARTAPMEEDAPFHGSSVAPTLISAAPETEKTAYRSENSFQEHLSEANSFRYEAVNTAAIARIEVPQPALLDESPFDLFSPDPEEDVQLMFSDPEEDVERMFSGPMELDLGGW